MYIPDPYRNRNTDEIKRFIQNNGFGTLALENRRKVRDMEDGAREDGRWIPHERTDIPPRKVLARHLPFIMDLDSDHYHDGREFKTLTAHMGKHYPIYNCFWGKGEHKSCLEGDEALVTFQGPDAYISPTWYDNLEGATWNYISVHVYGRIERLGDTDLEKLIRVLLYKYEKQYKTDPRLTLEMLDQRYKYLKAHIGAIRIHIDKVETDVQAAFKLSQDQTDWSQQNTMEHLRATGYPNAIAVADEMAKLRPDLAWKKND